ncbi:MAG: NAD(P)/FAD-dependent oxidoreductase [Rhodobacteraceae bacterium]|nr:NAD(P)/FAD-dependent oxidoreductase [Paracoccaceae bacterium]
MLQIVGHPPSDPVSTWFAEFEAAAVSPGARAFLDLLSSDACWRDLLGLTWDLQTVCGSAGTARALASAVATSGAKAFRVEDIHLATRVGRETAEVFFRFETRVGRGRGIVRLLSDPGAPSRLRAWTLLTALEDLKGFEERSGRNRPRGQSHSRDFRGPNWLDKRRNAQIYDGAEPAALVIGGGQAGLAIAARLRTLGVDTLLIERNARIGDNWRHRYHALTLHNQVQVNHLPYMPFPPNWPTYIPKDKLANWLESYAEAMELNVWTGTEMLGGDYDEAAGRWTVTLRREDGSRREMHPRHVIMATGVSGIPNRPDIPSLRDFAGAVLHSSEYRDGEDWSGRRAIVIGTGNSGHDIAQDLQSSGARVTVVQRSPTLVVNIEPSAQLPYGLYDEGRPLDECDLITVSMPFPLLREAHRAFTERARALDRTLLDRLEMAGFRLDFGEDGTGWQFKYLTRGGGYYFNVGCSDLIADGKIGVVQYERIDRFVADGVRMTDGRMIDADLVVLATGYKGQEHLVARLFGPDTARRVGPIWGFGDGLELRNMYCRTRQPGLWFIAGSLAQCRIYSRYLGLQIKAVEEGLLPRTI